MVAVAHERTTNHPETPEIADGMAAPHYFKSDKAIRELGYRAVPLAEMIRESYDWLTSMRWRASCLS